MSTAVTIRDVLETSLDIAWVPVGCFPRNDLPVRIRIIVRQIPTELTVADVTVADSGNYTQSGLQPNTVYSLQLIVVYRGNIGNNGTSVTLLTASPNPTITNFFSTPIASTVLWSHLQPDFIVSYNVSWSYVGPCSGPGVPSDTHQVLHGSRRNFTLTGLRPNSQYLVTLVAMNNIGRTESTASINTRFSGIFFACDSDIVM